jgi:hypothetical protein
MKLNAFSRASAALTISMLPVIAMAAGHHDSGLGWFGQRVVSAIIHAVIYGVIFKIFHAIGLVPSIILGAAILGGAYFWYRKRTPVGA